MTDAQFQILLEKIDNLEKRGDERFDWLKTELNDLAGVKGDIRVLHERQGNSVTYKTMWVAVGSVLTFGVVVLGLYHSLFAV